jgi:hypothetical protein
MGSKITATFSQRQANPKPTTPKNIERGIRFSYQGYVVLKSGFSLVPMISAIMMNEAMEMITRLQMRAIFRRIFVGLWSSEPDGSIYSIS